MLRPNQGAAKAQQQVNFDEFEASSSSNGNSNSNNTKDDNNHKSTSRPDQAALQAQQQAKFNEYLERIHYSDRYADEDYEYRHVILPKPLLKMIPKSFFSPQQPGVFRLLSEDEWRAIGVTQSLGWEHYEIHAPEPHILLFRRPRD